ncbi:hypothetical protein [Nonomuraea sp. NPDC049709]|uniref:hypothetical protein n=1 Tax=Nonomuraea sp. NPDC049709 TaxID=3154736 RepID=UPI0034411761
MRTRLPAALLLLLSWFLPAAAHAQPVQQVTAAHAATWRAEQQHSGVRQVPHPVPAVRAWAGPNTVTGAAAVPGSGLPGFRSPWAVLVSDRGADAPEARRPPAAAARAPPSTVR